MRLAAIEIIQDEQSCRLMGRVESDEDPDDASWFPPFTLWYEFPAWCAPWLDASNGDPFLAALLPMAMQTGERLAIEAPVSPRLLTALPDIEAIFAAFYPKLKLVPIEVVPRVAPPRSDGDAPGNGLFFSLGVDSFYSLLKNMRDHPADDRTVSHLLSVNGFDVTYEGESGVFPPTLLANFRRVATETGKTLLPVSTNIRRMGVRIGNWPMLHGAAMASIALALGAGLHRVSIAASATYDKLYPWGSHPVLDPLWSTETLTFVHDGCELNTIDKTALVARSDLAMATLRPCAGHGEGYNCGACEKCMRTMLDLRMADALDRCATLPHQIDPERLRAGLRPGGPVHMADFQRRLDALRALGTDPAVCQVLAEHLAQGMSPKFAGSSPRNQANTSRLSNLARRVRNIRGA